MLDDGNHFRYAVGITEDVWRAVYKPYVGLDTFSLFPVLLRPKSVGYIKLRSASPYDPPIIEPRYLTHPKDIITLVDAMKTCIKLGFTPPFRKLNSQLFETVIPGRVISSFTDIHFSKP